MCDNCLCVGNNECGNFDAILDESCTLNDMLICPCCERDSEPIPEADYDKYLGQRNLELKEQND